jgi:antitoxin component of MazEF toxin-antitoxin module
MKIVKIRRVGNSNVVTLPRDLESRGFAPETEVAVEEMANGELRIIPTAHLRELIRDTGRKVVSENREALDILAEHDKGR